MRKRAGVRPINRGYPGRGKNGTDRRQNCRRGCSCERTRVKLRMRCFREGSLPRERYPRKVLRKASGGTDLPLFWQIDLERLAPAAVQSGQCDNVYLIQPLAFLACISLLFIRPCLAERRSQTRGFRVPRRTVYAAVYPFFSEKSTHSPGRVPRPRPCVGVRTCSTFTRLMFEGHAQAEPKAEPWTWHPETASARRPL